MKAIVVREYGPPDAVRFEEVERPVPGEDEALIRVHASSVNYANLAHVTGKPLMIRSWFGPLKPKFRIPGGDVAGRVEATGGRVTQFQPGDEVFADLSDNGFGAYAEYVCVPEKLLAPKPANQSFEAAAGAAQAAVVALQGLRDSGNVQPGQKVLIVGASGGIGTFAVQIAKHLGAEVTGVCSTRNQDLARSLGADHVIDYTREDFAAGGPRYDVILATAGYRSILDYKRALNPHGTYVVTGGSMLQVFQPMLLGPFIKANGAKYINLSARANRDDLLVIKQLFEAGSVKTVIDNCYPLSETAEALRHYSTRRSRGKVIITT